MKHNFGAGPCILPKEVFEEASRSVIDFNNSGLSILEISHRSREFEEVIAETELLVRELLNVPDGHSILFLQGGASTQFAMVPMNLLPIDGYATYLDTGTWASKAIQEAGKIGSVKVIASSADKNYSYIPKKYDNPRDAAYFHLTTNNTIFGTRIVDIPQVDVPLVADMSSDIFSRKINVEEYALIYAGAQKNMGPAGITLVIVKDEMLGKTGRTIPSIFDYKPHIENHSMYNTPAVFSIYVSLLNLRWLKKKGGVGAIEKENSIKARTLYQEIDANPCFKGTANLEDRSNMNVTFVMSDPAMETKFLELAHARDLVGVKGHRSVGGFRISIYNAMGMKSVNLLVETMQEFRKSYDLS